MDLIALQDFVLVAQHGGIGAASRASGRSKATLSRHLAGLEDDLGVRLVERGANNLRLTEEGRALSARSHELLLELTDLRDAIQGRRDEPQGLLRISAPLLFCHMHLATLAVAFRARYPGLVLEVQADDRRVDLVDEGFDVVIRVNPPDTLGLVGRCFMEDRLTLVATPAVARRATEKVPAVILTSHKTQEHWTVQTDAGVSQVAGSVVLKLPSYILVRTAVLEDAGAAALPHSIVENDLRSGKLLSMGTLEGHATQIWVLHTARRLTSPKVRAFVDFVSGRFRTPV
ncbi:LysR family transcriptional regulator [Pseudoroseicyclus aestuarii]|uniref:DNA-binding transcriptional LysR family regulator n=1 Tax=Pseudoroseicyclus aestuarii TaxID=1795041 RepID=A0A318SXT7_9RHOB|nr:LysR family transcriptional regulator [Pseudoroseicyclus aestuarii]PYE86253.1 DNA-binding transcriptional LysR family regulator [Pseudoroseicyclus aestuarii]